MKIDRKKLKKKLDKYLKEHPQMERDSEVMRLLDKALHDSEKEKHKRD